MKNKIIVLVSVIAIIVVGLLLAVGIGLFNKSNKIKDLLYEKYGEDFKIVHDSGNEYEGGVIPSFQKTGYKNVIASPEDNKEIKFNVRLKLKPLEIVKDDYIPASIAYNTSKKIENNYKIGKKMYVHTSASGYECDGKVTNSFFDNVKGKGTISISIYVEGLDKKTNYTDYLNRIVKALNLDSNTTGTIRLYSIKENGVEKIKDYYKNSKDTVKVENSAVNIKKKYFETQNKDYFIKF